MIRLENYSTKTELQVGAQGSSKNYESINKSLAGDDLIAIFEQDKVVIRSNAREESFPKEERNSFKPLHLNIILQQNNNKTSRNMKKEPLSLTMVDTQTSNRIEPMIVAPLEIMPGKFRQNNRRGSAVSEADLPVAAEIESRVSSETVPSAEDEAIQ